MTLKKILLIGTISTLSLIANSASASIIINVNFSTAFTGDNVINSFSYNDGSTTVIDTIDLSGSQEWDATSSINLSLNNVANYEFIWEVKNQTLSSGFLADFTFDGNNFSTSEDTSIWSYSTDGTIWNNVTSYGQNGSDPWGTVSGISSSAEWIWDSSNTQANETLFLKASVSSPKVSITSPVPEPSTYALMLGGLGLIGFMAHRRRKQTNV